MTVYHHEFAEVTDIIDGDTLDLYVDHGFYTFSGIRVRLIGVDTHEIHGVGRHSEEFELGMEEKEFVTDWCTKAEFAHDGPWPFELTTEKQTGKYGRFLALLERKLDGEILNERLVDEFGEEVLA